MTKKRTMPLLFTAAVLSVALNLRAPITCVGPIVSRIQEALSLSGSVAGFLTTIPLLCFALLSPFAGRLAEKFGVGRVLLAAMLSILLGTAARSWLGQAGLIAGTLAIGAGIACGNVLLPVVIKALYPDKIGPMTSAYTTCMSVSAGLASGTSVALASALGWRGALAVWGIPAAVAAALWLPRRGLTLDSQQPKEHSKARVWRSGVAWKCTLYMGTQSIVYYSSAAWLPAIFAAKGLDAATAGVLTSVSLLMAIPANLAAPLLAARLPDTRVLTGGVGILYVIGGLLLWRGTSAMALLFAVILCGLGTGSSFSICMALIGMRTRSSADAARLSGMLQMVGYAIAAAGPVLLGRLYDATLSWDAPLLVLLSGIVANSVFGQLAGKEGYVE